jgi:hypothetical protein
MLASRLVIASGSATSRSKSALTDTEGVPDGDSPDLNDSASAAFTWWPRIAPLSEGPTDLPERPDVS